MTGPNTPNPNAAGLAPIRPGRVALFLVIGAITIGLAHLADFPAARHLVYTNVNDTDWGRMLREAGYVPTWLLVSIAFILIDRVRLRARPASFPVRDMWSRGALLLASAAFSGLLDEGIKLVVRRERPGAIVEHATYTFRAFADGPLSSSGFGMPSSHAAVAFGAVFMLWRLHPAGAPIWILIGVGCALTRVLAHAHYVSDVVAAAFLGYAVAWALWQWHAANARRAAARTTPTPTEPGA